MVIAGVMSGSSLDGLDIAIVRFGKNNDWELLWCKAMAYSEEWVGRLKGYHHLSAIEYVRFKAEYSRYIGQCLSTAIKLYAAKIDYISFHGHTLIHVPEKGITEQIGNGGILAAVLHIPTLTDFRVQDVAKGGVGTPLAPLVEINLFPGHEYYLNLGGIANLTKLESIHGPVAYDVCPFNQVLNYYSNKVGLEYDEDGKIAQSGSFKKELIEYLDSVDYFQLDAPKSLDNNWIVDKFLPQFPSLEVRDILHTYCHWAANCIAHEIRASKSLTSLMVSGGGAHNDFFIACLSAALFKKNCEISIPSNNIIDYKEAILMSLMAKKYLMDQPNVLSSVTGASSDTIGGALYKV